MKECVKQPTRQCSAGHQQQLAGCLALSAVQLHPELLLLPLTPLRPAMRCLDLLRFLPQCVIWPAASVVADAAAAAAAGACPASISSGTLTAPGCLWGGTVLSRRLPGYRQLRQLVRDTSANGICFQLHALLSSVDPR
jgi:hypothetical protein